MISFQDILNKTVEQRRRIRESLDRTNLEQGWHPQDSNLYEGLSAADTFEVKSALDVMSLAEVLEKGSTAMGADTIVATKLHDTLIYNAMQTDLCSKIGYVTEKWKGGNLKVNIAKDGTYKPAPFAGGKVEVNAQFVTATIAPVSYGIPILAGDDMIEDQEYGIVQWHVEQAAKACGKKASEMALTVLAAQGDGDGTANTEAGAADETNIADVIAAIEANGRDEFTSNTMVVTSEAFEHSLYNGEVAGGAAGDFGANHFVWKQPAPGYDFTYMGLDALWSDLRPLHAIIATDAEGGAMTNCVTLVFDRFNSMLTGRKRWLEIKNFSNAIEDIAGAVVSFRQDSVTLYKDAICNITEA